MAPKRFKKSDTHEENGEKYKNLNISDVLCPICRSIFIEPVTLPCNHAFCLACFNGTMENTTLTCPLCRIRIGSWLRSARKEKKIINTVLWRIIQLKFSKEIRKKLEGDDITPEEKVPIKLADPGEIRREYELQLERERSEIQKQRDNEAKASEIVIKKILEEEQNAAKMEEEKLRLDEEVAKRLAVEQERAGPSSCRNHTTPKSSKKSSIERYLVALNKKRQDSDVTKPKIETTASASKSKSGGGVEILTTPEKSPIKSHISTMCQKLGAKQQCSKAYQHLLLAKTLHCERAESNGSDSGDSIKQEMRYFKPIRLAPTAEHYRGDKNLCLPLLKIPTILPTSNSSAVIRSPQKALLVRIKAHPGSAFVSCIPEFNIPQSTVIKPSVVSDSGKLIKQYYNKKRNTLHSYQSKPITSPSRSPCLGFVIKNEQKHVTIMHDLVSTMSEDVNKYLARNSDTKTILKEVPKQNKRVVKQKHERIPKKINGCDVVAVDRTLQEQLDLEFARRLHEQLNNPRNRQTRASVQPKKSTVKTRSSPRKRQITLDELITPKKFKT